MQRASSGNGEEHFWVLFNDLMNVFLSHAGAICNFRDDFLVVVSNSKKLRKTLSDFASAASEFSTNGDNRIQNKVLLLMRLRNESDFIVS